MKHYELLAVLPGTLAEDELPAILDTVQGHLTQQGATELAIEDMGKTRLAYPMKHIRYGYFYQLNFQAEPTAVPAMQEKLKLVTELLRSMFSTVSPDKKKAQEARLASMQAHAAKHAPQREEAQEERKNATPAKDVSKSPVKTDDSSVSTDAKKEENKQETKKEEPKKKVSMKDIDEKLDEILDSTIANI